MRLLQFSWILVSVWAFQGCTSSAPDDSAAKQRDLARRLSACDAVVLIEGVVSYTVDDPSYEWRTVYRVERILKGKALITSQIQIRDGERWIWVEERDAEHPGSNETGNGILFLVEVQTSGSISLRSLEGQRFGGTFPTGNWNLERLEKLLKQ